MHRQRSFLFVCMVVASLCFSAQAAEQPNIVLVLADDFGWGDVGCYGSKHPTPELDRMAEEGTRFTQFYSASPICSPSRAGLLTGQFPARWQITSFLQTRKGNRECQQVDFLSPHAPTLPRALKAAGYATAHIGKWHLGGGRDVKNAPGFSSYGYDVGLGTWESPEPHPDITAKDWIWSGQDKVARWDRTRWMVDQTLNFLNEHSTRPCFVNLWLDDTHTPWVPGADELDGDRPRAGNSEANFRRVLAEMDKQIGRLHSGINELSPQRETFVLFLGDNGALPTFGQARNGGLRGSKLSLYEGGIRVPFIVWCPGRVPANRVDSQTVLAAVDLFPSLCQIASAAVPAGYESDGIDLSQALQGKENASSRPKPLFWEYGRNNQSFAYPREAYHRSPNLALRDGPWKVLARTDGSAVELFHVVDDPNETKNVADNKPEIAKQLVEKLLAWQKSWPEYRNEVAP